MTAATNHGRNTGHAADAYRDPRVVGLLAERIVAAAGRPVRLMEVCGTHTMAVFRHGLRTLLPDTVTLLSGPGCPVCVTAQGDIDAFVALARRPAVTLATFGDLMRVPGSASSLVREKARGADVRIVYSPLDALELARTDPHRTVVFLGVGFETTAPAVAAAILAAEARNIANFLVYSAHKRVPPALDALLALPDLTVDGFLLPGHVSVIIGREGYRPVFQRHRVAGVVAGFEPVEILEAVARLCEQLTAGRPALENAYPGVVREAGNRRAQAVLERVFQPVDAIWRGLGAIPASGLAIVPRLAHRDAAEQLAVRPEEVPEPAGCACGEVLTGRLQPPQCPLFATICTPTSPVGPCMVSSEGTCAAHHRYRLA